MNWRKLVYEMLEASGKPEDLATLEAMKAEVKGYDGLEAQVRVLEKTKTDLETEMSVLRDQGGQKTALETQVSELTKMVTTLTDTAKQAQEKEQQERAKATRLELETKLLPDLTKAFGSLTGKLMAESFISTDKVAIGDSGLIFRDGGLEYVGAEAIERIKTIHKDSIVGEPGGGTSAPKGGSKVPSGEDLSAKGANELFSMALTPSK